MAKACVGKTDGRGLWSSQQQERTRLGSKHQYQVGIGATIRMEGLDGLDVCMYNSTTTTPHPQTRDVWDREPQGGNQRLG